jgi:hypothetical protein
MAMASIFVPPQSTPTSMLIFALPNRAAVRLSRWRDRAMETRFHTRSSPHRCRRSFMKAWESSAYRLILLMPVGPEHFMQPLGDCVQVADELVELVIAEPGDQFGGD